MWGVEKLLNVMLDLAVPVMGTLLLLFWAPVLGACSVLRRSWNWLRAPSLRGKVVLISGASSGIGEHLAYEFARRGSRLVLTGLRGERLRRVGQQCERMGAEDYTVCEGDTAKEPDCHRMVQAASNNFGRLDVLVLNAGIAQAELFKDIRDIDGMRRVMDVNMFGYVWLALHALPFLRRTQGRILVNASAEAFTPVPRHSVYSASKAAVLQFFDTLRTEPVGRDLSVTVVFPGGTLSELTAGKVMDAEGRMVVDQQKRDLFLGPQPVMRPSTVAQRMVGAMLARGHYAVVPFWFVLPLFFRLFVPELLYASLQWQLLPWVPGAKPPAKAFMDLTGAQKFLYHAPATSQEEAEAAVYQGKDTGARPAESGAGGGMMEKAMGGVKQMTQPLFGKSGAPHEGHAAQRTAKA